MITGSEALTAFEGRLLDVSERAFNSLKKPLETDAIPRRARRSHSRSRGDRA